ncbi:MAG: Patatin-like phospholipase [Candidatus Accumulibacter phosphatis]|uniref:Patatin-like phospholipase n=1 Tax=Candidatus Accumulibacter phosphatis TaxID=327160 RepID=A0A080LZ00_9PROT|nr:patatin-like phospholipase family protein [Accumulibacter sp.]KFB74167.1 MAG: Patatin-like phospholipase [Candidatus Accumulibacter phosphatis]HRF12164.1 patatin-like phospholipase family protein [Candidatus Accumulibacter phosphatis]
MSLSTIIHAGMRQYERPPLALVLMGGGARTAYQVGVLRALATLLQSHPGVSRSFPFQILVGTSAGAINAAFLAGRAREGLQAFEELAAFWGRLRSIDVYRLNTRRWLRFSRVALALELSRYIQLRGALLDNTPLAELLRQGISLGNIESALRSKTIDALAVTGSSYTSGVHWTFCQTASRETFQPWTSPGRRAEFQPLTIAHLMASSAIPFLFPATALTVEGREEYFGDGSMRQITPLSPAMHLGAQKILVIGVGQPERSGLAAALLGTHGHGPSLGSMAGHVMASVFHDTLQADVEQTRRVAETINGLPQEAVAAMRYKAINVLVMAPTQSLDALALQYTDELPATIQDALSALGMLRGGGGALASYLLFEQGFVQSLMAMGELDATARAAELIELITGP